MRNVASELCHEFMRSVSTLTVNMSEDEVQGMLGNYMLRGPGWRLLYAIDRVGVKVSGLWFTECSHLLKPLILCSNNTTQLDEMCIVCEECL